MIKKTLTFARKYYLFFPAAISLIVGVALYFTGFKIAAKWEISIVSILEVVPLVWGMIQDLRDGTYGVDILAATAIVTSVLLGQYWAAIVIVIMLTGGEGLEDYADSRAETELKALLEKAPKIAHLIKASKTVDVEVAVVQPGNKLLIKPGEVVPVDALVIEGEGSFDESSLTGESTPQIKGKGDELLSGTISIDGAITVKALRQESESQYEQIVKLVKSARGSRAPFVRLADRYSIPFTVISFIIAGGAWALGHHAIRFLEVIVVATPCPLILAAPIAVISGMSRAARHGVIVKNGGALEKLAEAQTIAFDKTGTLTVGKPAVDTVRTFSKFTKDKVLSVAAALEKSSNHVLAQAIIEMANKKGLRIPKVKNVKEIPGSGLMAHLNNEAILVGTLKLMQTHKITIPKNFDRSLLKQTASLVAVDGKLAGVISFHDDVRPEAKSTLKYLDEVGIEHLLMISGDSKITAAHIAKRLGIKEFEAEALPINKLQIVEKLKNRPVVFVGDGVNDAPVLASADVGIALGARGETAASESADMVVMLDDISRVATAYAIAKRTFLVAQQSIFIGIALSIALMLIFGTGHFRPVYGAIIQELVDVIVIFNALRAHTDKFLPVFK